MKPWRWVVLFFTRPIHLADVKAFLRPLKRPAKAAVVGVKAAEEDAGASPPRPRPVASGAAARPRVVSLRDPALEVGVSEQPLDTLPAELQSEFDTASKREAERSRTRAGGAEG
jgi:hypothetical protein